MSSQSSIAIQTARRPRRRWRFALTVLVAPFALLALVLFVYGIATTPKISPGRSGIAAFDPETTGRLEQRAWAAYYYRDWPQLFDLLVRLSRGQFGLSLPQALWASYLGTEAQVVWARQGDRDGRAEERMQRFYEFVKGPTGASYDPARAAQLEVRWWAVHRQRDRYPDHSALTAALAATYAEVYQLPVERMVAAAEFRAEAMDVSDQWIRDGQEPNSPLLVRIADLLVASYAALHEATAP